jgi:hypothetical protein
VLIAIQKTYDISITDYIISTAAENGINEKGHDNIIKAVLMTSEPENGLK